jgi:putative ABC transport system ATP-binding protein
MSKILSVKKITKTYGKGSNLVKAVNDVSFDVEEGEFVAIIGASGSGKSTLLHMIGGVDRPDKKAGSIEVAGEDITKLNNNQLAIFRRQKVGIIYQFYNLIPVLTVRENITLSQDLDKKPVDEHRLNELISALGLKNRENYLPNQLSGGQQQRVAIGRALYGQPALILADEPTGNLDSKSSKEIVELLKLANKKFHQTIIIVTHDLKIAEQADRIITIEDGKNIISAKAKK